MKQIFDTKQERINPCGSGLVVLMLNEESVSVEEQRQTGEDTYKTETVEKYQYDVVEVNGVGNPVNEENITAALKKQKKAEVEAYDQSGKVNGFVVKYGGKEYRLWYSAEKRNQLKQGIEAWKNVGNETYNLDLRDYGQRIEAKCDELLAMIDAVERYAVRTYNTTSEHITKIDSLQTIEEVVAHDVKSGYPDNVEIELG